MITAAKPQKWRSRTAEAEIKAYDDGNKGSDRLVDFDVSVGRRCVGIVIFVPDDLRLRTAGGMAV